MRSDSPERQRLDAAREQWGTLPGLTVVPYLVAYFCLALALTGSPKPTNGVFVVVLAVLLVGSSLRRWRSQHLSSTHRRAVMVTSATLGLVMAVLVGRIGLA